MKQIVPIVLTALMLTSVLAGMDFADELKDTNEMETGGRAADELKLHDVLQPRETFVDAAGNTRNGIDIGDVCLLYTSPSPRDGLLSRMPSSA